MFEAHIKSAKSVEPYIIEMYDYVKKHYDYFVLGKPFGIGKLLKHLNYNEEIVENGFILPHQNKGHFIHIEKTLGNSLGVAEGIAISNPDKKVFCFISDSQIFMGPTLEAILSIGSKGLKNLTLAIDYNKLGSKGPLPEINFNGLFWNWHIENLYGKSYPDSICPLRSSLWIYHSWQSLLHKN